MKLIEALHWRYATKRMTGKKIPQEKLDRILEEIRLSASSFGLQPYSIFVIDDHALLEKIKLVANNQPQITEASHLLVFAAWENVTSEKIDEFINQIATVRNMPVSDLKDYKEMIEMLLKNPAEVNFNWCARQAYIALGTGLIAAAEDNVDATPMEGFDRDALDLVLNLKEKGLKTVVLMALGYRDAAHDYLASTKKVRREKEKLFIIMH